MSLKVYGYALSRTFRTLWMAEELKLAKRIEFEHDGGFFDQGERLEKLLALNPMGQVPVIEDDGFVLSESMAINFYLAKKYDHLAPQSLEEESRTLQWMFWAMTSVETNVLNHLKFKLGILGAERNDDQANEYRESLRKPFTVLNHELGSKDYLLGDRFSVADLNVSSVLLWARMGELSLSEFPFLDHWLTRCLARESVELARSRTLASA